MKDHIKKKKRGESKILKIENSGQKRGKEFSKIMETGSPGMTAVLAAYRAASPSCITYFHQKYFKYLYYFYFITSRA